ncbi:MAG: hypothetical protein LBQ38_09365 [Spirochaetaceae bacterium]|jgi:hypothetical protein|nr:hypothetical protein [Spirochaetaceae bacterium]
MKIVKNAALCVLAAFAVYLLNHSFSFLTVTVLGLPLFLDTLFTCALAFTVGPLPGISITVMSYCITGTVRYFRFGDRGTYLYALCAVAEVLLIYGFRRGHARRENSGGPDGGDSLVSTMSALLLLYLLTCMTVSLIGGMVDWTIAVTLGPVDNVASAYTFFKMGLLRNRLPLLAAAVLSRIPVNIIDRFITIFGGYGLGLLLRKIKK